MSGIATDPVTNVTPPFSIIENARFLKETRTLRVSKIARQGGVSRRHPLPPSRESRNKKAGRRVSARRQILFCSGCPLPLARFLPADLSRQPRLGPVRVGRCAARHFRL